MKIFLNNKKGFTLLEIIIVTMIISFGLLGVFSLFWQVIKAQNVNKNELIASQLAQEGLEIVRNIRDENWELGNGFSNNFNNFNYALDYTSDSLGSLTIASGINDSRANLKINGNFYSLSGTEKTPFNRIVSISLNGDYMDVACIVQWNERGGIKQYKAQTYLYDWK